jgi:glycosidase
MRHPMQWNSSPTGGFTSGDPWLPPVDPAERNVEAQRDDPGSLLELYRLLIEARGLLGDGFQLLEGFDGIVAFERPEHVVAINATAGPQPAPLTERPELTTHPDPLADGLLAPHAGAIAPKSS